MPVELVSPALDGIEERLLALLESPGGAETASEDAGDLAARHGLAGLLYVARLGRAGSSTAGRAEFLANSAANRRALDQLAVIARAFHSGGVPFVVLKGCAALLLGLYRKIGCREIGDLDLLVPERSLAQAGRILGSLGYAAAPSGSLSPIEELVAFHSGHGAPYSQPGRLPVELHGSILYGRGRNPRLFTEIWEKSSAVDCHGAVVRCPCPAHFLIHAAIHFHKHLESRKHPAKLKDVADALLLLEKFEGQIEWGAFWQTVARWRVGRDVASVVATLNRIGRLTIPMAPPFSSADAIPARVLVRGSQVRSPARHSLLGYLNRVKTAEVLPRVGQRLRYYLRLAFPWPAALRERYGSPGLGLTSLYVRRFASLSSGLSKTAIGLVLKRPSRRA